MKILFYMNKKDFDVLHKEIKKVEDDYDESDNDPTINIFKNQFHYITCSGKGKYSFYKNKYECKSLLYVEAYRNSFFGGTDCFRIVSEPKEEPPEKRKWFLEWVTEKAYHPIVIKLKFSSLKTSKPDMSLETYLPLHSSGGFLKYQKLSEKIGDKKAREIAFEEYIRKFKSEILLGVLNDD